VIERNLCLEGRLIQINKAVFIENGKVELRLHFKGASGIRAEL
jgi:hypothetical protein